MTAWTPPYLYVGLAEREELMSRPTLDAHVTEYRKAEGERERQQARAEEEAYWRRQCESGGLHRPGQCPYCPYFYD